MHIVRTYYTQEWGHMQVSTKLEMRRLDVALQTLQFVEICFTVTLYPQSSSHDTYGIFSRYHLFAVNACSLAEITLINSHDLSRLFSLVNIGLAVRIKLD